MIRYLKTEWNESLSETGSEMRLTGKGGEVPDGKTVGRHWDTVGCYFIQEFPCWRHDSQSNYIWQCSIWEVIGVDAVVKSKLSWGNSDLRRKLCLKETPYSQIIKKCSHSQRGGQLAVNKSTRILNLNIPRSIIIKKWKLLKSYSPWYCAIAPRIDWEISDGMKFIYKWTHICIYTPCT